MNNGTDEKADVSNAMNGNELALLGMYKELDGTQTVIISSLQQQLKKAVEQIATLKERQAHQNAVEVILRAKLKSAEATISSFTGNFNEVPGNTQSYPMSTVRRP